MKRFICGMLAGAMLTAAVGAGAAGIWDKIDVLRNDIKVVVNGSEVTADNFLYNDTTYLPLRAISEALNEAVEYDEATNTAYIGQRKDDTVVKSKYTPPEGHDGLFIIFNERYYIMADVAYDEAISKGYFARDFQETRPFLTFLDNNKKEIGTWETIDQDGWTYIDYDTYIDEIEPLLK